MLIKLFDIHNGLVVPTEHCYQLQSLKVIMENFPGDYLNIYAYIFYMTCPDAESNPFFNVPEEDKEDMIIKEVGGRFSTEEDEIITAKDFCSKLYETSTYRAYLAGKISLDKVSKYLSTAEVTSGRDGSGTLIKSLLASLPDLRESVNKLQKDLEEEISIIRGNRNIAYDTD